MRSIRRRNWFIKRIALGLAVAALAAPVAHASVDEGIPGQPNAANEVFKAIPYRWPSSADDLKGIAYRQFVTDFPSSPALPAADYGVPNPTATGSVVSRGDLIEVVRSTPNATPSDKIEFVRTQSRSISEPQVASRFARPNTTSGDELASWNVDWQDAGIGAGLALVLVLLGGGAALASRHARAQTA